MNDGIKNVFRVNKENESDIKEAIVSAAQKYRRSLTTGKEQLRNQIVSAVFKKQNWNNAPAWYNIFGQISKYFAERNIKKLIKPVLNEAKIGLINDVLDAVSAIKKDEKIDPIKISSKLMEDSRFNLFNCKELDLLRRLPSENTSVEHSSNWKDLKSYIRALPKPPYKLHQTPNELISLIGLLKEKPNILQEAVNETLNPFTFKTLNTAIQAVRKNTQLLNYLPINQGKLISLLENKQQFQDVETEIYVIGEPELDQTDSDFRLYDDADIDQIETMTYSEGTPPSLSDAEETQQEIQNITKNATLIPFITAMKTPSQKLTLAVVFFRERTETPPDAEASKILVNAYLSKALYPKLFNELPEFEKNLLLELGSLPRFLEEIELQIGMGFVKANKQSNTAEASASKMMQEVEKELTTDSNTTILPDLKNSDPDCKVKVIIHKFNEEQTSQINVTMNEANAIEGLIKEIPGSSTQKRNLQLQKFLTIAFGSIPALFHHAVNEMAKNGTTPIFGLKDGDITILIKQVDESTFHIHYTAKYSLREADSDADKNRTAGEVTLRFGYEMKYNGELDKWEVEAPRIATPQYSPNPTSTLGTSASQVPAATQPASASV